MEDKNDNALNILLQHYLETEKELTDKQKSILEAAVEIFSEKGFAAASTNEIASRAGVAEGTIFRHYKTKKNLLFSIVSPTIIKLGAPTVLKDFENLLGETYGTFEEFLDAIIRNRLEFVKNNQAVLKILINEISYHTEMQEMAKEIFADRIISKMEFAIKYFQEKGEVKTLPLTSIIRLIISTMTGYGITRFFIAPNQNWDDQKEIEIMVEFLAKGLKE